MILIIPSTDWWGLEVVLPPPSLAYLSHAPSVAHAIINFLTAMSIANNGVAEILPFVRYISQYVDFEYNSIKQVDEGKGVVCAATWIMPAAMVPRAWDFADPPPAPANPAPVDPAPVPQPAPGESAPAQPISSATASALPSGPLAGPSSAGTDAVEQAA
jgi:hypothetical protein